MHFAFEDSFLAMSIADHGSGIPEEQLSKITQKYYRGENAAGKEGCGLGLYISGVLMQKMHGEMRCSAAAEEPDAEHCGLNVTLLIPLS